MRLSLRRGALNRLDHNRLIDKLILKVRKLRWRIGGRLMNCMHDLHAGDDLTKNREAFAVSIARTSKVQRRLRANADKEFCAGRADF